MTKDENEKIDLLLERNAAEQLAHFDWQKLNAAISNRLDHAQQGSHLPVRLAASLRIAAVLAVAAAAVFITVKVNVKTTAEKGLSKGSYAAIKFAENRSSASVVICPAVRKSLAKVALGGKDIEVAKCDVKIIDSKSDLEEDNRAAWVIISRCEPVLADNDTGQDMIDLIRLF